MIRGDIINSLAEPEMPIEYGFHYSGAMSMVRNAVSALELFNQWPDVGGYFDQDAFLIDDMMLYKRLYNHIKQQYKREDGNGDQQNNY